MACCPLTIERDLLVGEQADQVGHAHVLLLGGRVLAGQEGHNVATRPRRMQTRLGVLAELVVRALPHATDALEHAACRPLEALVALVLLEAVARVQQVAVDTVGGQLGQRLLHGQIAAARRLADLDAAVGTRGLLVLETRICEQVREAAGAHQVAVGALFQGENHSLHQKNVIQFGF